MKKIAALHRAARIEALEASSAVVRHARLHAKLPDSPTGKGPMSIAVGDFNNDGKLDYITANNKSGTVTVGFGKGTGAFGNQTQIGVGSQPTSVVVGDFNGDQDLDFAVRAGRAATRSSSISGNGNRGFTKAATLSATDLSGSDYGTGAKLVAADFNGDGKTDLVVTGLHAGNFTTYLGQGNGQFSRRRGDQHVAGLRPARHRRSRPER